MTKMRAFAALAMAMVLIAAAAGPAEADDLPKPDPYNPVVAELEAYCNAKSDATVYSFAASVTLTRNTISGRTKVSSLEWSYVGEDPADRANVPDPAKNNVHIEFRRWDTDEVVVPWDSADNESYLNRDPSASYSFRPPAPFGDPTPWILTPGNPYYMRFRPAFDKRDFPDVHCYADTTVFVALPRNDS